MTGLAPIATFGDRRLRVLVAHNAYMHAGGEDAVVTAEIELLASFGHTVIELRRDNSEVASRGRLGLAVDAHWSRQAHADLRALIERSRPDVVHVHNTLPLLSPSVHWAAAGAGVAVVQTLHNFRLACPQAMFLREGKVCEDCLGRAPLPAVMHACYRGSRAQSAVVASVVVLHRALGTWSDKVDRFIALSEFSRGKFVDAGLPPERITVKANFVPARKPLARERSAYLFVGRLAEEKGIAVLGRAASLAGLPVRIVGSGPEARHLAAVPGILQFGTIGADEVRNQMEQAKALLLPSICYENFPRTIVEAYACGLPVIASRIGSLLELVEHGQTGMLFESGDAADLARTMRWAEDHPDEMAEMGRRARQRYEERYTPEINHAQLIAIYQAAMAERAARRAPA